MWIFFPKSLKQLQLVNVLFSDPDPLQQHAPARACLRVAGCGFLYKNAGSGANAGFASICFTLFNRESQGDVAAFECTDIFEEDTATEGRDFVKVAEYLVEEVGAATSLFQKASKLR